MTVAVPATSRRRHGRRQGRDRRPPPAPQPGALGGANAPCRDRPAVEPGPQVVGQGLGHRISAAGVLLQALQADRLQVARDGGVVPPRRLGRGGGAPRRASPPRVAAERGLAGQQGVEDGAQAVDVAGGGDRSAVAGGLLGRHVGRRAEDGPGMGELDVGLDPLGQAEVGDVRMALGRRPGCWPA